MEPLVSTCEYCELSQPADPKSAPKPNRCHHMLCAFSLGLAGQGARLWLLLYRLLSCTRNSKCLRFNGCLLFATFYVLHWAIPTRFASVIRGGLSPSDDQDHKNRGIKWFDIRLGMGAGAIVADITFIHCFREIIDAMAGISFIVREMLALVFLVMRDLVVHALIENAEGDDNVTSIGECFGFRLQVVDEMA